jgi:hypothetical protein
MNCENILWDITFHLLYSVGPHFAVKKWHMVNIYLFDHEFVRHKIGFIVSYVHVHESVLNLVHLSGLISPASSCKFTVCAIPYYKCLSQLKYGNWKKVCCLLWAWQLNVSWSTLTLSWLQSNRTTECPALQQKLVNCHIASWQDEQNLPHWLPILTWYLKWFLVLVTSIVLCIDFYQKTDSRAVKIAVF